MADPLNVPAMPTHVLHLEKVKESVMKALQPARGICILIVAICTLSLGFAWSDGMTAAVFDMDITPPLGFQMAYDPVINTWDLGLRAKGVVLIGSGAPIVLCAMDWIGIGNDGNKAFREALARAASTSPDRVTVHTVHQHDAPACDFSVEALAAKYDLEFKCYKGAFAREILNQLEAAVRDALPNAQPITHYSVGTAEVKEVASNRRIPDETGKIRAVRFTSCADPELRAEPEGIIDSNVCLVGLWNEDTPVAILSYYACHPQSYYRTGIPNPDFPGLARFMRQLEVPQALHIHFTGAAGNIGAGKYNDGSKENRLILAQRLADGMKQAWEHSEKQPLDSEILRWEMTPALLPAGKHLNREQFESGLENRAEGVGILSCASGLAWLQRCEAGDAINISCLHIGKARILHMPGELFVEYQLAAKAARPDLFVTMAAYGDYGPGYIGTARAYETGGYETGPKASLVAPEVESVLLSALSTLLETEVTLLTD